MVGLRQVHADSCPLYCFRWCSLCLNLWWAVTPHGFIISVALKLIPYATLTYISTSQASSTSWSKVLLKSSRSEVVYVPDNHKFLYWTIMKTPNFILNNAFLCIKSWTFCHVWFISSFLWSNSHRLQGFFFVGEGFWTQLYIIRDYPLSLLIQRNGETAPLFHALLYRISLPNQRPILSFVISPSVRSFTLSSHAGLSCMSHYLQQGPCNHCHIFTWELFWGTSIHSTPSVVSQWPYTNMKHVPSQQETCRANSHRRTQPP